MVDFMYALWVKIKVKIVQTYQWSEHYPNVRAVVLVISAGLLLGILGEWLFLSPKDSVEDDMDDRHETPEKPSDGKPSPPDMAALLLRIPMIHPAQIPNETLAFADKNAKGDPVKILDWKRIVIHHSATTGSSPESIDRYHREVRKWANGFGYHFLIGNGNGYPDGKVYASKRWKEQMIGAHVANMNTGSIGICLVGNFEETVPTEKAIAALKGLLIALKDKTGLGEDVIMGHKDLGRSDCPGQYFPYQAIAQSALYGK